MWAVWNPDLPITWYLIPMVIAASLVYAATRYESWPLIFWQAGSWALWLLFFLGCGVVILWLIDLALPTYFYWFLAGIMIYLLFFTGRSTPKKEEPTPPNQSQTS